MRIALSSISLIFTILSAEGNIYSSIINNNLQFQTTKPILSLSSQKMTIKEATMKAINRLRTTPQICSAPVKPLIWNENLYQIAKEHNIDMAVNGFVSHNGSGRDTDITARQLGLNRGSYFYERVNREKNSKKILSAELVTSVSTKFYKRPADILNYWIKRPKSCKVLMDARFKEVGLSKVVNRKTNRTYWTLMLIGDVKKEKK